MYRLTEQQKRTISHGMISTIESFFENPDNQIKFEKWQKEKIKLDANVQKYEGDNK